MRNGTAAKWPKEGLPEHVQEFVNWLVTPEWERPDGEKTQTAWAKTHDVTSQMLTVWKRNARVKHAIQKRCDELNLSPDKIQEVIASVHRAAVRGDVKAAALYLQHADRLSPKRIVIEDGSLSKLSDAELKERIVALGILDD